MAEILFPKKIFQPEWEENWQRYYHLQESPDMHYQYVLNLFLECGLKVEYFNPRDSLIRDQLNFEIGFFGKRVLIDISDFEDVHPKHQEFDATFKFHYSKEVHSTIDNLYPFTPVSFTDWSILNRGITYHAKGKIRNNQFIVPWAKERRLHVRQLINDHFGDEADVKFYGTSKKNQLEYFKGIENTLLSVHVPGSRSAMLDRAQAQMFGFGVCTVSPKLPETLAWDQRPLPGVHYLPCADDYRDLIEILEWAEDNSEELVKIGQNASTLFQKAMTPQSLISWMQESTTLL